MPARAQTAQAQAPTPTLASAPAPTPTVAAPAPAPPPPPRTIEIVTLARAIPNHLTSGNQIFEASVTGLRAYLESIRGSNPQLYAQLAPDVERLESSRAAAQAVLATGLIVGAASVIYAFAGRSTCQDPSIDDPHFAADSAAWGACNQNNIDHLATYTFLGMGAAVAGGLGAWALAPSRSDFLGVVNKNNRLGPEPLRLQLGYDPGPKLAFAGATLTF